MILLLREDVGIISETPQIQYHAQAKVNISNLTQMLKRSRTNYYGEISENCLLQEKLQKTIGVLHKSIGNLKCMKQRH